MAGMPFCCVWSGEDPYGERNGDRVAKACVMKKHLRKKEFVFFCQTLPLWPPFHPRYKCSSVLNGEKTHFDSPSPTVLNKSADLSQVW